MTTNARRLRAGEPCAFVVFGAIPTKNDVLPVTTSGAVETYQDRSKVVTPPGFEYRPRISKSVVVPPP